MGRGLSGIAGATRIVAEPVADDDHQLVAAVRRGDDRAFEALYERYQRRIHAYVMGMVKDHGRAEDVTQEVFVSALRRMRETERPIAFKPWIYEIAKNACIDQFRRTRRTEEVPLEADEGIAPGDYLVGSDPAPDDAVAAKQELDSLCGAFGGLSDTHHEILLLRELEGLSYREIGERMGMSRPAVESTLFRARRRLTEEFDELVSGARCMRIQNLIATASGARLGTREQRRLSRHVAYCQPCRREALAAGLDSSILTHVPLRKRAAAKIAGLLPFPIFGRWRGGGGEGTTCHARELKRAGVDGAHADAVRSALGGMGQARDGGRRAGGRGRCRWGRHQDRGRPRSGGRAQARRRARRHGVPAALPRRRSRPARWSSAAKPAAKSERGTRRRGAARRGSRERSSTGSGSTPAASAPVTGGGSTPASSTGASGGGGGAKLPPVTLPAAGGDPVAPVKEVVDGVGQTVAPVVNGVTETVQGATEPVTGPVTDTVNDVGGAVQGATGLPVPTLP